MSEEKCNEEQYIKERLEDQINWYDKESVACQKAYKAIKLVEIIMSAMIPIIIGFWPDINQAKFLVALFGAILVVLTSVHGLYSFHQRWIQYRSVCEALRHEKYLFETRSGMYDGEKTFPLLVQRVEKMTSTENINWAQLKKCPAPKSK